MQTSGKPLFWKPALVGIFLVLIVLLMLRLGFWQLNRAAEKQAVLDRLILMSEQAPSSYSEIASSANTDQRFLPVSASGVYLPEQNFLIDNQVFDKRVGYQVVTPFEVDSSLPLLLVARGWVPAGDDRNVLPIVETSLSKLQLRGRLNTPFAQPPLWNTDYPVAEGRRWQFLKIDEIESQLGRAIYPLMLELAPDFDGDRALMRRWNKVNDEWVAKHKAYSLQWFSMAAVLLLFVLFWIVKFLQTNSTRRKTNE